MEETNRLKESKKTKMQNTGVRILVKYSTVQPQQILVTIILVPQQILVTIVLVPQL
jgi:hypothetical protein